MAEVLEDHIRLHLLKDEHASSDARVRRRPDRSCARLLEVALGICIRLFCSHSNYDQAKPGNQRNCAENRRKGKCVLGLVRDLDRAEVDVFFLVSEGDSACSVSDDAKDNEKYSDYGGCLHWVVAFPRS
jgi:hypothetical protein